MYLKRLELIGFKSFAERTELEFGPGITSVVGPNGSGKSNICDAIRWVLGEMSARDLRGSKMEDVIFGGSDGRKPMGYAEVTITFDNSDGTLRVPYREVEVTRRVDRAGTGEYFINRTPCRLKDIVDLFLDTGIGKENYSIIGQGRIDENLSQKPEERRALFEEAAGISRYKTRKKEATRKLEETEQHLLRVGDLIQELEGQLDHLAAQAETARRYRDLEGELTELEVGLLALQLREAAAELAGWREQASALRTSLQAADVALADTEQTLETARSLIAALDQELGAVQAERMEAIQRLERAEARERLLGQETEQAEREAERLALESAALAERRSALEAELAGLRERIGEVARALAAARTELSEREAELSRAQADAARHADALERRRARALELARAVAERREAAQAEERARARALERLERLRADAAAARTRLEAAAAEQARCQEQWAALAGRQAQLQGAVAAAREEEEAAAQAAAAAADRISRLRERIGAVRSRLGVLEELKSSFEGFHRGVRAVLQGREQGRPWARGVIGALAELVRCDPAHERAIEVAMGAAVQHIVTATEEDAQACIEELKRQRAGRATFLPLSIIRPAAFTAAELRELEAAPGFVGVALDLCQFEERIRPAVAHVLGRVAVVRDLDAAVALGRRTGFRHRVVTLDGEILHPGGALTGGVQDGRQGGLLTREREMAELAAELSAREAELQAAEQELRAAQAARQQAAAVRAAREQALRQAEAEILALRGEWQKYEAEAGRWAETLRDLEAEMARVAHEVEHGDAAAQRLVAEAEELAAEQAALEAELGELGEAGRQLAARVQAAAAAVTEVRVRIASLEQEERSLTAQAERVREEVAGLAAALADREGARSELQARRERLVAERAAAGAEVAAARAALAALAERQEAVRTRLREAQAAAVEREKALRSLRREQQDLMRRAAEADSQVARLEAEVENITLRLADQHGLTPGQVAGRELAPEMVEFARQRIGALREEIRALGPVNLAAIAEHERAQERYRFLLQQRSDLEEAKAALYRAIDELDRRIIGQFQESFQAIRREFQRVYAELFEGGRADLVLVDEQNLLETGVEIIVQPPGKKPTPLALLSGGERAMTAIALLFALLRYKPTPFVVLDEVEAALDEANVARFGRYLKQLSRDTQFICVTHQRGTMEVADVLYGVTMEGTGVSRVVSIRLVDAQPTPA